MLTDWCSDFCGLWYHHVREDLEDEEPALVGLGHGRRIPSHGNSEVDSEKNFAGFRRVRIIAMMLKPMPPTSLQASEHGMVDIQGTVKAID